MLYQSLAGLLAAVALLAAGAVCIRVGKGKPAAPRVVRAADGHSQLTLPDGWEPQTSLHAKAELQAKNEKEDISLVVLSEAKSDFAKRVTYHDHSRLTRETLVKKYINVTTGQPEELQVGGRKAVRYSITGDSRDSAVRVRFVHVTVDGETHFHQLVFAMATSKAERHGPAIAAILASFRDLP